MTTPTFDPERGVWIYAGTQIHVSATLCPGACIGLPPSPEDAPFFDVKPMTPIVGEN